MWANICKRTSSRGVMGANRGRVVSSFCTELSNSTENQNFTRRRKNQASVNTVAIGTVKNHHWDSPELYDSITSRILFLYFGVKLTVIGFESFVENKNIWLYQLGYVSDRNQFSAFCSSKYRTLKGCNINFIPRNIPQNLQHELSFQLFQIDFKKSAH